MLLEEFDPARYAVIDPQMTMAPIEDFPKTVISVFSHELFDSVLSVMEHRTIAESHDVDGIWPIYEVTYQRKSFGFYKARLGAPACVSCFEEVIGLGAKRIILLGNCGVLKQEIQDCGIIIPTSAIRDEGTSYHYAPASDFIEVNRNHQQVFCSILKKYGYPYTKGITWTTDAFFRETPNKVLRRKQMGAICVEMECAAMQAMCSFRNVDFFQYLYAGDNLDYTSWEPRSLSGNIRLDEKTKIALLAFELAAAISEENKSEP